MAAQVSLELPRVLQATDAHRKGRRYWLIALFLALSVLTLPPALTVPGVGLDPSWIVGLNMAFWQHFQWGTQIVWTYGPYGFLASLNYYQFNTWIAALIVTLAVHAGLFLAIATYLQHIGARSWQAFLVGVVFLLPLAGYLTMEYEGILAVTLLLFIAGTSAEARRGVVLAGIAGSLLGLLLLVKATSIVMTLAMIVPYAAFVVITKRMRIVVSLLMVGSSTFLLLWLLAGQTPLGLGSYFRSAFEIVNGYTPAMSVLYDYPVKHVIAQVALGAVVVVGSATTLLWSLLRRDCELACLLLLVTPLLFVLFKEGYVRFGDRQLFFYAMAAVIETFVSVRAVQARSMAVGLGCLVQSATAAAACAVLVSGIAYIHGGVHVSPTWPLSTLQARLASYRQATGLLLNPSLQEALVQDNKATVRRYYGLHPEQVMKVRGGTVDIVPWDIDLAYGYDLAWAPRPVLQSYSAYTPYLDALDAAHFSGLGAPDHVLLSNMSIDGRYPLFDEPATFRAIAANYEVVGQGGSTLLLARRDARASVAPRPIATVHARLGELIGVPISAKGPIYAAVRVPYSTRGRVANLVFQPGELRVQFRLADRDTPFFRLIPAVAEDGLLVSTYIANAEDLRTFLQGSSSRSVHAIQIVADRPVDYTGAVEVTFYSHA